MPTVQSEAPQAQRIDPLQQTASIATGTTTLPIPAPIPESNDPLPTVVPGSEPWHNNFPAHWLPIITRDIERQRKQVIVFNWIKAPHKFSKKFNFISPSPGSSVKFQKVTELYSLQPLGITASILRRLYLRHVRKAKKTSNKLKTTSRRECFTIRRCSTCSAKRRSVL